MLHVPPLGTFLHQWCAPILLSQHLPSGSETGRLDTHQADLLPSVGPTAAEQSELHGDKRDGLLRNSQIRYFQHMERMTMQKLVITRVTFVLHCYVDSACMTNEGEGPQADVDVNFTGDDVNR